MFAIQIFTVCIYVAQKLNFINTLIEVVFVIFYNFHAYHLLSMDVITLNSFTKCCWAKILNYLVSACYDAINDYWEVFCFFKASFLSIKNNSQVVAIINYFVELCWIKFVVWRHKFNPLWKYRHFTTVVILNRLFRLLIFLFVILFQKDCRVISSECLLFFNNRSAVFLDHLCAFLFSECFIFLWVWLNSSCWKIIIFCKLSATSNKIFLWYNKSVKTWIIIVLIFVNTF